MRSRVGPVLLLCALTGCPAPSEAPDPPATRPDGPTVLMDFDGAFWDAPFPSEHRRGPDGRIALDGFPVLEPTTPFVSKLLGLVDGTMTGFGTTSGIFFRLEATPTALPSLGETVTADSPVFLTALDPASPDYGVRVPVTVDLQVDGGPYGALRHLSLLPLQGRPLRPDTSYAAVVTRALPVDGVPLGQSPSLWALRQGEAPLGMEADVAATYRDALATLATLGTAADEIAGLAVFTTQDPTAETRLAATWLRDEGHVPTPLVPWERTDVYDGYCVYRSEVEFAVLQDGEPPFSGTGGAWAWTATGEPAVVAWERSRIDVTVPRTPPITEPPNQDVPYPTVLFVRTGGGADRALIDRGVRDATGAAVPGTGYAQELAAVGWAGVEVDGPHGGLRNVTGGDEQFLMFNMTNPVAMRDNVRQSAVELSLLPPMLDDLVLDTSDCPGAPPEVTFDARGLIGHSMGATIAPLVLGVTPELEVAALSGAGGSWLANVVHKESPLPVRPLADNIVGYTGLGRTLHEHDPLLTLLQWGGESADPPVYGRLEPTRATRGLMVQGIVDTYILPPMANALSLSLGWPLAGEALDEADPRLDAYPTWSALAPFADAPLQARDLPLRLGEPGDLPAVSGVVVQYEEDPIEDGHEVFFQLEGPKEQVRSLLLDHALGEEPLIPAP